MVVVASTITQALTFYVFNLFIYFGVFIALHGLSLVSVSRGYSSLQYGTSNCDDFSCSEAQALEAAGSVVVVQGLSCSEACEIFPD